jgi:hypothetical protein
MDPLKTEIRDEEKKDQKGGNGEGGAYQQENDNRLVRKAGRSLTGRF